MAARIGSFIESGCDYIDLGVESSNPDGADVPLGEQMRRIELFFEIFAAQWGRHISDNSNSSLEARKPAISLDSFRYEVLEFGLKRGVGMINDISGLADSRLLELALDYDVPLISMFNFGKSQPRALAASGSAIAKEPRPDAVLASVVAGLRDIRERALKNNFPMEKLILDPGMGFFLGKDPRLSFAIMRHLDAVKAIGNPVCVSVSHKSFLNIDAEPAARAHETALAEYELLRAGVDYVRTHDPAGLARTLRFCDNLSTKFESD